MILNSTLIDIRKEKWLEVRTARNPGCLWDLVPVVPVVYGCHVSPRGRWCSGSSRINPKDFCLPSPSHGTSLQHQMRPTAAIQEKRASSHKSYILLYHLALKAKCLWTPEEILNHAKSWSTDSSVNILMDLMKLGPCPILYLLKICSIWGMLCVFL